MSMTGPQPISTIPPEAITPGQDSTVLLDSAHLSSPSWLDGFRRITTSGEFIPEIDGLRFIAISVVVIRHVSVLIAYWLPCEEGLLKYGRNGVELFFVISGFILSTPFALHSLRQTRPVKLKRYFLRRLTRLEPPYLLSILIYFVLKLRFQPGIAQWSDLWVSIFYVSGIVKGHVPAVSTVAWSLEVEIGFYLIMPLLAMLFWIPNRWVRRASMVSLAAAFVIVGPFQIHGMATGEVYDHILPNYIQYFLAGLLLSDVYATEWRGAPPPLQRGMLKWGDLTWVVGWPVLLWVFVQENTLTRAVAPIIIFLLYVAVFHSVWARKLMRIKWVTTIGGMCYSIYLMHNLALEGSLRLISRWMPHQYFPAMLMLAVISIPLTLIECGVYFRLIERPCMRPDWPKRLKAWILGRRNDSSLPETTTR
jgi:peptidoglycan/LPS O-acetylase OafA/YrhL